MMGDEGASRKTLLLILIPVVLLITGGGVWLGIVLARQDDNGQAEEEEPPLNYREFTEQEKSDIDQRLQDAIADLDRREKNWRIRDLEAARPQIPHEKNAAVRVRLVQKKLPESWKETTSPLDGDHPNWPLKKYLQKLISKNLKDCEEAVAAALALESMSEGRFAVPFEGNILQKNLHHLQDVRRVSSLLLHEACQKVLEKDYAAAARACRASLNTARSMGDECYSLSHLVKTSCVYATIEVVEFILAQGSLSEQDLQTFQEMLAQFDCQTSMELVARGERAIHHDYFENVGNGSVDHNDADGKKPDWVRRTSPSYVQYRIKDAHPVLFPIFERYSEILQSPIHERLERIVPIDIDVLTLGTNPVTPLLPSISRVFHFDLIHRTRVRCAIAGLAAERYRLQHRAWPKEIDDLKAFAPVEAQIDPCTGKLLLTERQNGALRVYSQGDRGLLDVSRSYAIPPEYLMHFRLYDPNDRCKSTVNYFVPHSPWSPGGPPGPGGPGGPGFGGQFGGVPHQGGQFGAQGQGGQLGPGGPPDGGFMGRPPPR